MHLVPSLTPSECIIETLFNFDCRLLMNRWSVFGTTCVVFWETELVFEIDTAVIWLWVWKFTIENFFFKKITIWDRFCSKDLGKSLRSFWCLLDFVKVPYHRHHRHLSRIHLEGHFFYGHFGLRMALRLWYEVCCDPKVKPTTIITPYLDDWDPYGNVKNPLLF